MQRATDEPTFATGRVVRPASLERTWERADVIVSGAPAVARDPSREVVTLVISDHGGD